MAVEEGRESSIVGHGQLTFPLLRAENLLNHQRINILSRDFLALNQHDSHSGTAPSAISSIAAATSMVNSSARRRTWRRRPTPIPPAAICPPPSPPLLP